MKKYTSYILILIALLGIFSSFSKVNAQVGTCTVFITPGSPTIPTFFPATDDECDGAWSPTLMPSTVAPGYYVPLAPLPGLNAVPVADENALGNYLNVIIKLAIGIAAVMAMVMIVMGGIQYMTSELPGVKGAGKEKIINAILGLLVALGAWIILFTINPDLLNTNVAIPTTVISYTGSPESSVPFSPATGTTLDALKALDITCDSSSRLEVIAASFMGKSTYDQNKRNTVDANTAYFDCSSYVAQVYACKGLPSPGGVTATIFGSSGIEQIQKQSDGTLNVTINQQRQASINGIQLKIGDLIGWTDPDGNGPQMGHVLMYIGGGRVIDSRARTAFNQAVSISDLNQWANDSRLKFIKRLP